jgi:type II secretory ATPase GspE/PulE/Tfp pilus assembly ATPase PilB-like protein
MGMKEWGVKGAKRAPVTPAAIIEFLSGTPLFKGCERTTIEKISPHVYPADVVAGTVLVEAGKPSLGLGFVFAGRVVVRQLDAAHGTEVIERVEAGGAFGEAGAMLGTTQPYEVVALDDSIVLLLGQELVQQIASRVAPFSHAAARRLAAKVGTTPPPRAAGSKPPPIAAETVPFVRASTYQPTPQVIAMVPPRLIQQHRLFPLGMQDRRLVVGLVDPYNAATRLELSRALASVDVSIVAISQDDYNEAYARYRIEAALAPRGRSADDTVRPADIIYDQVDPDRDAKQAATIGDDIVAISNRIVAHAIDRGASDVHLDTDVTGGRVRYRIHGQLFDWDTVVQPPLVKPLIARFKVLSGLDPTERRVPQDGRIGLRAGKREVDIRVSTIPTGRGEKLTLRVFEAATMARPLETVFLDHGTLEAVRTVLQHPYGAVVVAGPIGSGKTTTLYAALGERKRTRPDTSIITVEDPIEYRLPGVTQVQVNHAVELGLSTGLRAMLRHDPDVMMVGEIRDAETAQLALEAAMTGHLLLASIHANTAMAAVQRLENLGCSRALIGQALVLVLAQRLARRLCARCAVTDVPPPATLESLAVLGLIDQVAPIPLPKAVGCAECAHTGYSGRIAVIEMLLLRDVLRTPLMTNTSLAEIERNALDLDLLVPFRRAAGDLLARGLLSPGEALLALT